MRYSQKACSTTPVQTATWKPSPTRPPSASAATATLTWSRILGSGIRPTVLLAAKTYANEFSSLPKKSKIMIAVRQAARGSLQVRPDRSGVSSQPSQLGVGELGAGELGVGEPDPVR